MNSTRDTETALHDAFVSAIYAQTEEGCTRGFAAEYDRRRGLARFTAWMEDNSTDHATRGLAPGGSDGGGSHARVLRTSPGGSWDAFSRQDSSIDPKLVAAESPADPVTRGSAMTAVDAYENVLIRPYAITGGRTSPRYHLQVETLVVASRYERLDLSGLSPECQAILGFCRDWRSVAEISAVLRMPLGVARVLIADMAVDGLVRVHQLNHAQGRPDLDLLERVLQGLRRL